MIFLKPIVDLSLHNDVLTTFVTWTVINLVIQKVMILGKQSADVVVCVD